MCHSPISALAGSRPVTVRRIFFSFLGPPSLLLLLDNFVFLIILAGTSVALAAHSIIVVYGSVKEESR